MSEGFKGMGMGLGLGMGMGMRNGPGTDMGLALGVGLKTAQVRAKEMMMDNDSNSAVLKICGWDGLEVVLSMRDACEIVMLLAKARKYKEDGYGQEKKIYIGGELPDITLRLITEAQFTEGLVMGEKPK